MGVDFDALNKLLLACIVSGVLFGIACDAIRAFRLIVPHGKLLTALGDTVFCLLCTCVLILCFYNFSYGHMRMYGFIAAGGTFAAWELTVGRFTLAITERTVGFVGPIIKKLCGKIKFSIDFLIRRGYTVYTARRLRRLAHRGFGLYKGGSVKNVPQN